MSKLQFNKEPYFDDFDVDKNFYQILFKPSVAIQTRELNQLQTILAGQAEEFANHIFKFGSSVKAGKITYRQYAHYVRLKDFSYNLAGGSYVETTDLVDTTRIDGRRVKGTTSGLEATCFFVEPKTEFDPATIYVKYLNTAIDGETTAFLNGEILEVYDENGQVTYHVTCRCNTCDNPDADAVNIDPIGTGSLVTVDDSIYYIHGKFVNVTEQTISLDKYGTTPSYKVGFDIVQSVISASDDASLYDNALGTPNYTAPGADRYKITLNLVKKPLTDENDEEFVLIAKMSGGFLQEVKDKPEYGDIMNMIARRTYDESGNYTVSPFKVSFMEHLKTGDNTTDGWKTAANGGLESKLAAILTPGKAYVQGREIERISEYIVEMDKARDTAIKESSAIRASFGNYIIVDLDPTSNLIPRNVSEADDWFSDFNAITLWDGVASGGNTSGAQIGTARVKAMEMHSGVVGVDATYKLFIFDVKMNPLKTFNDVRSVYKSDTEIFVANVVVDPIDATYKIYETFNNHLLFQAPFQYTSSIRDANNSTKSNTLLTLQKKLVGAVNGSGIVEFVAEANETFLSYNSKWMAAMEVSGGGNFIPLDISVPGTVTSTTSLISIVTGDPGLVNRKVVLICDVLVSDAKEKTKTLQTAYLNGITVTNDTQQFLVQNKVDAFRIISATDQNSVDWTNKFTLYTNQKDNYYDLSYIMLNKGETPPDTDIDFVVQYFEHSNDGYYFSVDSYKSIITDNPGVFEYEDIPTYTTKDGTKFNLTDTLDFRPSMGVGNDFEGVGGIINNIPLTGSNIIFDITYYLNRIDIIVIDEFGEIFAVKGKPAIEPIVPRTPERTMKIYEVYLNAYTYSVEEDIRAKFIDNRRYTMRDIGNIEKRLSNVEYYVSFNLLEKATSDQQILDASGNNRFKNGFLVDNFTTFNGSDSESAEYSVSLDIDKGELRPTYNAESIPVVFDDVNSTSYTQSGDVLTLPFSRSTYIEQPFATKSISVTPYLVITQKGDMVLSPNSDFWRDTENQPALTVGIDTGSAAVAAIARANPFPVQWGNWANTRVQNVGRAQTQRNTQTNINGNFIENTTTVTTFQNQRITQTQTGTRQTIGIETENTSLGTNVTSVDLIPFTRSRNIQFFANNMLPNTILHAFFDGVNVDENVRPLNGSLGSSLVTDSNGTIAGVFSIPNSPDKRFLTGQRTFKLTNSATNSEDPDEVSTMAEAEYTSGGLAVQERETILSVTRPELTTSTVSRNRTVTQRTLVSTRTGTTRRFRNWNTGDPIAQSFRVDDQNGVFLESVDTYFNAKSADSNVLVWFEVRNMVNGYPGEVVVPYSRVEKYPNDVNVSDDGTIATNFKFKSPVYLSPDNEYCFVLGSSDPAYRIYASKLGGTTLGSNPVTVSSQPSLGSMFKSQNNSTWTAEQYEDVKFKIHRCKFNSGATMHLEFKNGFNIGNEREMIKTKLGDNPFETENLSQYVRVFHKNHGFIKNDKVKIEALADTWYIVNTTSGRLVEGDKITNAGSSATIKAIETNGVDPATGENSYKVKLADLIGSWDENDPFIGTTPYEEILGDPVNHKGGDAVWDTWLATNNHTAAAGYFKQGVGNTFNGIPITDITLPSHTIQFVDSLDSYIIQVATPANASGVTGGSGVQVESHIQVDLFNVNANYVDFNGTGNWTIDAISHSGIGGNGTNYVAVDAIPFIPNETTYLKSPIKIATELNEESNLVANKKSLVIKADLTGSASEVELGDGGGWTSPVVNLSSIQFTGVTNRINWVDCVTTVGKIAEGTVIRPNETGWGGTGDEDTCIANAITHYPETDASEGIEDSKYVMNPVNLATPATGIKVYMDHLTFIDTAIDLYYRTVPTYIEDDIHTIDWVKAEIDESVISEHDADFKEGTYSIPDVYGDNPLDEFKSFQIKIVLRSMNSARPPKVKNFRAIAVT